MKSPRTSLTNPLTVLSALIFGALFCVPFANAAQTAPDYNALAQQYLTEAQAATKQAGQYQAQAQAATAQVQADVTQTQKDQAAGNPAQVQTDQQKTAADTATAERYATQAASAQAQADSYMAQYYDAKTHIDQAAGNTTQAQADAAQSRAYAAKTSADSNTSSSLAQITQTTATQVQQLQNGSPGSGPQGNPSGGYFIPLTQLPGIQEIAQNGNGLPAFLNTLYKLCIGAAALIAVLQIIRAGLMWMSAGDNSESISKAKGLISSSIFGLILVLSPFIVFSIINPGVLSLNIGNLSSLQPGTPVQSVIQSTGQPNPACTKIFKDGDPITPQNDNTQEECCSHQTPGSWSVKWDYTKQPYVEYCGLGSS